MIHFVRRGTGEPALVFVHGFTCAHADWAPQLEHFGRRQLVAACDLRGHGRTPGTPDEARVETFGADVAALVRELGAARTVLVGHSMGCRVILQAALDAPDKVAGLVFVDGSMLGAGDPDEVEARVLAQVRAAGVANVIAGMFREMFVPATDPQIRRSIIERAASMPPAIAEVLLARMTAWDARHGTRALQSIRVPMLALQSTSLNAERVRVPLRKGDTTPFLDAIRRAQPDATIEIIEGAGHFTHLDATAAVNRAIEGFCARIG